MNVHSIIPHASRYLSLTGVSFAAGEATGKFIDFSGPENL